MSDITGPSSPRVSASSQEQAASASGSQASWAQLDSALDIGGLSHDADDKIKRMTGVKRTASLGASSTSSRFTRASPESLDSMSVRSESAPPDRGRSTTVTADTPKDREEATGIAPSEHADDNANPQVDRLILDGLKQSKDRVLLLRSDLELEKFVKDASRTRLRIAPPAFPPALNSYQRLLIHRLADTYKVARELEPASQNDYRSSHGDHPQPTGSTISGTIVLVKTPDTQLPSIRISTLFPSSSNTAEDQIPTLTSKAAGLQILSPSSVDTREAARSGQMQGVLSPSELPKAVISPSPVRIMSRNVEGSISSASSSRSRSPGSRSASGSGTQSNLTFEEREAAYAQARLRIFGEVQEAAQHPSHYDSFPISPSTAVFVPVPGQVDPVSGRQMYTSIPADHLANHRSLRASAPSFLYEPPPTGHSIAQAPPSAGTSDCYMPTRASADQESGLSAVAQPLHPGHHHWDGPISRPTSSHSHSSHSSRSTTTSACSIRTASTSSVSRSRVRPPVSLDLRPMRQTSGAGQPPGRQSRHALPSTGPSSSTSTSTVSSRQSRHSHGSSDTSFVTNISRAGSLKTSLNSQNAASPTVSSAEAGVPQTDDHPSLPSKPEWLPLERRDESEEQGPLSHPSPPHGDTSVSVALGTATRSDNLPIHLVNAGSKLPRKDKTAQSTRAGPSKIVEYPPMRYDPARGFTTMASEGRASSQQSSQTGPEWTPQTPQPQQRVQATGQPFFSSHAPQHLQPHLQAGQPTYHPYFVPVSPVPPGMPHGFPPNQVQGIVYEPGVPRDYGMPSQRFEIYPHATYQPGNLGDPTRNGYQPQGHFIQQVPMVYQSMPQHQGAMTAADILASGEMLYSYDLPRPVPRSGATLFDPNASSTR